MTDPERDRHRERASNSDPQGRPSGIAAAREKFLATEFAFEGHMQRAEAMT